MALPDDREPPEAPEGQPIDSAAAEAITAAFETFFDGSITDTEVRIDQIEDFAGLRRRPTGRSSGPGTSAPPFEVGWTRSRGPPAPPRRSSTRSRLNDQVVFVGRIGEAVLAEGRWFVSRATFCDLMALSPGAKEVTVSEPGSSDGGSGRSGD